MKRYAISAAVGACCLAFSPFSSADGFYLGAGIPYNSIKGDFDGQSYYRSGSELIIVPEISGAWGWSVLGGLDFNQFAIEAGFSQTKHDATWLGAKGDVTYRVFDFDLKYRFIHNQPMRPFVLIGLNVDSLTVKDGSANSSGAVGDGKYTGAGFNLGVGTDYFINDHVSVGLSAKYRFVKYSEAEMISNTYKLSKDLSGDGFNVLLSTAYHF